MFKALIQIYESLHCRLKICLFRKFMFKGVNIGYLYCKFKVALLFVYLHYQSFSLIHEILQFLQLFIMTLLDYVVLFEVLNDCLFAFLEASDKIVNFIRFFI